MHRSHIIVIILLALLLAGCAPSAALTETIAIVPTFTKTAPSATPTQTPTYTPEKTSLPAATRTAVATYTPSVLSKTPDAAYKLREWTANQADLLIDQVFSQLLASENDPGHQGTYGYANYIEQYKYLAFVESEALLRFPDAQQAETWRWDVCYNLALSYMYAEDSDAPELQCYAKLIEAGLNSGQTDVPNLANWFRTHESRFSFEITANTPPQGYASSHISLLETNALLWLLEKDGKFQVIGLRSSMFFFRESSAKFQLIDLTGDHYPELVLNFNRSTCCGAFTIAFIYDLSSGIPQELSFMDRDGYQNNQIGGDYDISITGLEAEGRPGLLLKTHYRDPLLELCQFKEYDRYFWSGHQFELAESNYGIDKPDKDDNQEVCQFAIDSAQTPDELKVVVPLVGQVYDSEFPEYRQAISFRLGEYYARQGSYTKAFQHFSNAIAKPAASDQPGVEWARAAQTFLDHYKSAGDFYKACSSVSQCDQHAALLQVVQNIEPGSFLLANEILQKIGVPIKSSGVFDFDADGNFEQWLVVQPAGKTEREFWILVKAEQKVSALFVTKVLSTKPEINSLYMGNRQVSIELNAQSGKFIFFLEKMSISNQPYILLASPSGDPDDKDEQRQKTYDFWVESIDSLTTQVLAGADPRSVKETLLQFKQSRNDDCKKYPCAQLYYLLGLTNELSGDQQSAIDAYMQIWKGYPDSIYAIMARSKLERVP